MLGRTRPDFVWLTSFLMILKSQCNKHLWMEWLGVAIMFDGLLMVFGTPSYLLVFDGCSSSVKWCDGQRPSLKSYFLECKKDAINVMIQQRVSTLWRVTWKLKNQTNVTNTTLHLLRQAYQGVIWKLTLKKNCFNSTNVTMNLFWQAIWKPPLGKNHFNASNATLHLLKQAIWGHIWNLSKETHHSRETTATMHLFRNAVWSHLKIHTGEKWYKCNQCDYACVLAGNLRKHLKTHSGKKSSKCNQCYFASVHSNDLRRHLKTHSGEKSF